MKKRYHRTDRTILIALGAGVVVFLTAAYTDASLASAFAVIGFFALAAVIKGK